MATWDWIKAFPKSIGRTLHLGSVFEWTTWRSIGNSPVTKLSIIFPIVGHFILFNKDIEKYITPSPFKFVSSNLNCLYFGLLFVGVSSFIYKIFCPPLIKKYGLAHEYISADRGDISHVQAKELQLKLEHLGYKGHFDQLRMRHGDEMTWEKLEDWRYDSMFMSTLEAYFDYMNKSKMLFLSSCAILYISGFIILLIPPSILLYQVISKLIFS